jgi:PadR family transcriptional regulator AphA
MEIKVKSHRAKKYIISTSPSVLIKKPQDILALLVSGSEHETNRFILKETNFDPAFYDLKTGLAGEITQKFANYRVKAAIIGKFEKVSGKRFREFMLEANKGNQVYFTDDEEDALIWLTSE